MSPITSPTNNESTLALNLPLTQEIEYIGAKAIFDPNFIPHKMVPREKPAHLLEGIITDAIEDHFSTNVNVIGMKGVGKNLLINRFLERFDCQENNADKSHIIVRIDCDQKDLGQIFFEIIAELCPLLSINLDAQEFMTLNLGRIWSLLKFLIQKISQPMILYLKNPEDIPLEHLNKIFTFAKSTPNLQVLTSLNIAAQRSFFKQYEHMDHHIPLDMYSISELYEITSDRAIMTFPTSIIPDAIQSVVDFIAEFDTKVPGACIDYLKNLYPIMQNKGQITAEDLREVSQYHFEGFSLDALTLADFVMQTSIEDRLFLDYLINYFQQPNRFYIPFNEIKKAFLMMSEELGFKPVKREFYQSFGKILGAQILRPSNYAITQSVTAIAGVYPVAHYLTLPLSEVSDIMKVSFGDVEDNVDDDNNF